MNFKIKCPINCPHLNTIFLFCICMALIITYPFSANASGSIRSNIRVIHASSDTPYIDPGLRDLAKQLQSVFKYTSYRLIDSKDMTISYNNTGTISLPGDRILEVIPAGMSGDRIKFTILIFKNGSQVFSTQILLKNGSSVTIGGPDFNNGYLLFNISGISN